MRPAASSTARRPHATSGLGRMMSTKKDYIGASMALRAAMTAADRPVLVGFKPLKPEDPIGAGAHFIRPGAELKLRSDEGYMTSTCWSPTLGSSIGLGVIVRGTQRLGEQVRAYDPIRKRDTLVEICPPVFVDPAGERLRG